MEQLWQRTEAWLRQNAPDVYDTLLPGATEEEIRSAEAELGVRLPDPVREFYRVHNGQATDRYGFTRTKLLYGWQTPHLGRVVHLWRSWKEVLDGGAFEGIRSEPDPGVRDDWWNPAWIPITQNAAGDHLCLDLAPAPGGKVGQVITMWHAERERGLVGLTFEEWVEEFVIGLEEGEYVYSPGYGGIIEASQAAYYAD